MNYEILEEAGDLEVRYDGPPLDAYSFGVLQINLHEMAEKIATRFLIQEGVLDGIQPLWRFGRTRFGYAFAGEPILRLHLAELSQGSIDEVLRVAVLGIVADPFARSVLSGVIANMISGISSTGLGSLAARIRGPRNQQLPRGRDSFEVGPNVRAVVKALAENSNGSRVRLRLRRRHGDMSDEVEIDINPQG